MTKNEAAPTVELIMSEFGGTRQNAGGAEFGKSERMNPTLSSFRTIFPDARVTLYTDQLGLVADEEVETILVDPPFSRGEPRYGWRAHDYYQAYGMLQSHADVAIAMDSDMLIVADSFRVIVHFAQRFGLAVPINPRLLVRIDGGIGVDSTYASAADPTQGLGLTYNLTPMAFGTGNALARALLERYCALQRENPGRGAIHLVDASHVLGFQPYVLPPQWCVCSPRDLDSKHLWREAVVLHVGHKDVLPRWRRERVRNKLRAAIDRMRGR